MLTLADMDVLLYIRPRIYGPYLVDVDARQYSEFETLGTQFISK